MKRPALLHFALTVELLMDVIMPGQGQPAEKMASAHLRGRIIACPTEPSAPPPGPRRGSRPCARAVETFFESPQSGWPVRFQAFFRTPLPTRRLGVVVLSASQNPVALKSLQGKKGQTRLSTRIIIFYTDTPERPHRIQVYYLRGRKAIVLASATILLKKAQDPKFLASRAGR